MLRALGRYIDTDAWRWLCEPAGQVLFWPPNVSGWDDTRWLDTSRMRARWNIVDYALAGISVDAWNDPYPTTETAEEALARAVGLLGGTGAARRAPRRAARLRPARGEIDRRQLAERPLPGDAPERPAAPDRRQPGHGPAMSREADQPHLLHATTRARSCCARPRPKPGKGLPAIEPGMPEPAGTGLSRRSFLSRSAGLALAVYGASKIPLSAFETGIAQAAQGDKIIVSVFFDGGVDSLSVLAPVGDPKYAALRPTLALKAGDGTAVRRGPEPALAPGRGQPGDAARRGQGQHLPGDRLRPPRPVALHLAPLLRDRRARDRLPDRLAGPLHRLGRRRREPAAGALDGRRALADDRHRRQAGGGDRQRRRLRPLVGGLATRCATRCTRASPGSARCPRTRRRWRQVRRATAQTDKLRQDLGGVGELHQPGRLPGHLLRPQARRARRLHRRRAADAGGDDPRRRRLRHPRRPGRGPRAQPARDLRGRARLPARPRSARPRRPGDDRDVERVRAAAGGERLGRHRPRRRRLRLRDRLESQGRDGRRVPRPRETRRLRQPARDQRLPRRCTARCSSSGSATTPARSSPAPPASPSPSWSKHETGGRSRRLRWRSDRGAGAGAGERRTSGAAQPLRACGRSTPSGWSST